MPISPVPLPAHLVAAAVVLAAVCACCRASSTPPGGRSVRLTSSDAALVRLFDWARPAALRCVGGERDPVGPWYEAALPGRQAFCIRDVAHQCIGAEIVGLGRHNANMLRRFVEGIAPSRDYCSFWEIDRLDRPAPVDYASDDDFWYPLNANFDLVDACLRLYQWTGDAAYVDDTAFDRFFRLTLNEYTDRWQLQPGRVMGRPAMMNLRPSTRRFRQVRGLPSYDEGQADVAVGSDLVAMALGANRAYADVLARRGQAAQARRYRDRAAAYRRLLESRWWDPQTRSYYAFRTTGGQFRHGGIAGNEFLLWARAATEPDRIRGALASIHNTQVEVLSYLPMLTYRCGLNAEGYDLLQKLAADPRRDYPEAAFGAVEAVVCGLMGVEPCAARGRIATCPRLTARTAWVAVEDLPVYPGLVSVRHSSPLSTRLTNRSGRAVTWRARFQGSFDRMRVNGRPVRARHEADALGAPLSFVDVRVDADAQAAVTVETGTGR